MRKVNGAPGQPPLQPAELPAQGMCYVLGEGWGEGVHSGSPSALSDCMNT